MPNAYRLWVTTTPPEPDGAVLSELRGSALGCFVLGTVFIAAVVILADDPLYRLVSVLFCAGLYGSLTWLAGRGRLRRTWSKLDRAGCRESPDPRAAFTRGLMLAVTVTAAELVVLVVLAWFYGLDDVAFASGFLVGAGLQQSLIVGDLRRWQQRTGLKVCRRTGAPRIAWTGRQARSGLIAVPASELTPPQPPW